MLQWASRSSGRAAGAVCREGRGGGQAPGAGDGKGSSQPQEHRDTLSSMHLEHKGLTGLGQRDWREAEDWSAHQLPGQAETPSGRGWVPGGRH